MKKHITVIIILLSLMLVVNTASAMPEHPDDKPHKTFFPLVHTPGRPCPEYNLVSDKIGFAPTLLPTDALLVPLCAPPDSLYMTWHSRLHPTWYGEQVPMIHSLLQKQWGQAIVRDNLDIARGDLPRDYNGWLIILNEPDLDGQAGQTPLDSMRTIGYVRQEDVGWPQAKLVGTCTSHLASGTYDAEVYTQLRQVGSGFTPVLGHHDFLGEPARFQDPGIFSTSNIVNCTHFFYVGPPELAGIAVNDYVDEYRSTLRSGLIARGFNPTEAEDIVNRPLWLTEVGMPWDINRRLGTDYTVNEIYLGQRAFLNALETNEYVDRYFVFGGKMWQPGKYPGGRGFGMIYNTYGRTIWGQAIEDHIRWTAGQQIPSPATLPTGYP